MLGLSLMTYQIYIPLKNSAYVKHYTYIYEYIWKEFRPSLKYQEKSSRNKFLTNTKVRTRDVVQRFYTQIEIETIFH